MAEMTEEELQSAKSAVMGVKHVGPGPCPICHGPTKSDRDAWGPCWTCVDEENCPGHRPWNINNEVPSGNIQHS